jgi:hypothetical protein
LNRVRRMPSGRGMVEDRFVFFVPSWFNTLRAFPWRQRDIIPT